MLQGMMPKYFCTIHSSKPKSLHSDKKDICNQTWNALVNRSSFKDQLFLPSSGVLLGGRWPNPLTPRSVMKKTWSLVLTFRKTYGVQMRSLTLYFHMVLLFYFVRNSNFWVCGGNLMAYHSNGTFLTILSDGSINFVLNAIQTFDSVEEIL